MPPIAKNEEKYLLIRRCIIDLRLHPDDVDSWKVLEELFGSLGESTKFKRIHEYFSQYDEHNFRYYHNLNEDFDDLFQKYQESLGTSIEFIDSPDIEGEEPSGWVVPEGADYVDSIGYSWEANYNFKQETSKETVLKEFIINDYITLKLIQFAGTFNTAIFLNDNKFLTCKYLLLNIPEDELEDYEDIDSIDEAIDILDHSLEFPNDKIYLDPYTEFFGHCSNLQAWAEFGYDTRILHSNLSFPLLKELVEVGDSFARKVFNEEIINRFLAGKENVQEYLIEEGYFDDFSYEELECMYDDFDKKLSSKDPIEFPRNSASAWYILAKIFLKKENIRHSLRICSKASDIEKAYNKLRDIEV